MDTVAFPMMASDHSHQPSLGSVSHQVCQRGYYWGPWGGGVLGGVPLCQHPSLPCSPLFWVTLAAGRSVRHAGVRAAPAWHSRRVGHLACVTKPNSWCKRCLAAFPLVHVLAQNGLVVLGHLIRAVICWDMSGCCWGVPSLL